MEENFRKAEGLIAGTADQTIRCCRCGILERYKFPTGKNVQKSEKG